MLSVLEVIGLGFLIFLGFIVLGIIILTWNKNDPY